MGELQKDVRVVVGHSLPYFTFGVIADIQYADKPDGLSGWRTMRYYQESCSHLCRAIQEWNMEDTRPRFVLQLGDIIDGFNKRGNKSEDSLAKVLAITRTALMPFHHVWGNHELYNFSREYLMKSRLNTTWMEDRRQDKGTSSTEDYYAYHFSPHTNFRFIVVDTYDLSVLGRNRTNDKHLMSEAFLMNGTGYHMMTYNGGLGQEQLAWLNDVLTYSDKSGEKVVIAGKCLIMEEVSREVSITHWCSIFFVGHIPVHPKAKRSPCLVWNYQEVLRVLQAHHSVVCYLAGHDHSGGYHQDSYGIHHVTMEGVIESPLGSNAFGTIYAYEEGLFLRGGGRVRDRYLPYRKVDTT
ncbi:hypothetical protein GDO81_029655 [Engystomops pustulosus]|uniref:Manganese-dependent ADP-ribose/CDP-alcohol diphosphatase n=1 Tax=Engystomops pustulosus TaxID=76066 RepID=A0AAV6YBS1_ENGPU|nr:hypothetical protein GDO81_029655 [Engystomops pustulosus]